MNSVIYVGDIVNIHRCVWILPWYITRTYPRYLHIHIHDYIFMCIHTHGCIIMCIYEFVSAWTCKVANVFCTKSTEYISSLNVQIDMKVLITHHKGFNIAVANDSVYCICGWHNEYVYMYVNIVLIYHMYISMAYTYAYTYMFTFMDVSSCIYMSLYLHGYVRSHIICTKNAEYISNLNVQMKIELLIARWSQIMYKCVKLSYMHTYTHAYILCVHVCIYVHMTMYIIVHLYLNTGQLCYIYTYSNI